MGNKHSGGGLAEEGGAPLRRSKRGSKRGTRDKNTLSCPNLDETANADSGKKSEENLDVKIYRSYSNYSSLEDVLSSKGYDIQPAEPTVDIKVYRRSATSIARANSTAVGLEPRGTRRSSTLPRNVGRSRSVNVGGFQAAATVGGVGDSSTTGRPSVKKSGTSDTLSRDSVSTNKRSTGAVRAPPQNNIGITGSGPDAAVVKRNLRDFEKLFVYHMTDRYSSLSDFVQLSALSVAVGPLPRSAHPVSLWEYLTSDHLPIDLLESKFVRTEDGTLRNEFYRLTIPPALFHGVMHVRRDVLANLATQAERTSLAQELFMCLAVEAAGELARMFEYQIGLLSAPAEVDLLASHAANCALEYLKTNNLFMDRNTVVHGVVRGRLVIAPENQKTVSVIVGEKEFKWRVEDVFKKPGLMKICNTPLTDELNKDGQVQLPWRFFTSERCDPATYGYRTSIIEVDYARGGACYPSVDDEASFIEEVDWDMDGGDIHRGHRPQPLVHLRTAVDSNQNVSEMTELSDNWKVAHPVTINPTTDIESTVISPTTPSDITTETPLFDTNGVEIRKKKVPSTTITYPQSIVVNSDDQQKSIKSEIQNVIITDLTVGDKRSPEIRTTVRLPVECDVGDEADAGYYSYRGQSVRTSSDEIIDTEQKKLSPPLAKIPLAVHMPDLLMNSFKVTAKNDNDQLERQKESASPSPTGNIRSVPIFEVQGTVSPPSTSNTTPQLSPISTGARTPGSKVPPAVPVRRTPYIRDSRITLDATEMVIHSPSVEASPSPTNSAMPRLVCPPQSPAGGVIVTEVNQRAGSFYVPAGGAAVLPSINVAGNRSSMISERSVTNGPRFTPERPMSAIGFVSADIAAPNSQVFATTTAVQRTRSERPPVPPKKKTASLLMPSSPAPQLQTHVGSNLSPVPVAAMSVVTEEPTREFMNFNDFLGVLRASDSNAVNSSSTNRVSSSSPPVSRSTSNEPKVEISGTILDFNKFLDVVEDPTAPPALRLSGNYSNRVAKVTETRDSPATNASQRVSFVPVHDLSVPVEAKTNGTRVTFDDTPRSSHPSSSSRPMMIGVSASDIVSVDRAYDVRRNGVDDELQTPNSDQISNHVGVLVSDL